MDATTNAPSPNLLGDLLDPIRELSATARAQHGVFSREQALAVGYSSSAIDDRVRRGEWTRIGRTVLALAGAPVTFRQAAMAAVLSIDGAVASHETAATLQGFRYLGEHPIAISVPPESWHQLHRVTVHRYQDLAPQWVTEAHGIPVTVPTRTMIDLAAVIRGPRLERILDAALDHHGVEIGELQRTFNRLARRGRRGIGPMRRLLEARGDGFAATGSELERRFLRFVRDRGYPEPAKQLPTFWADRLIGLADFAYPSHMVLIELDGRLGHSQLLDTELDRVRDQRAMAAGWRVIRITWRQLHDRPDQVAEILDALLRPDAAASA